MTRSNYYNALYVTRDAAKKYAERYKTICALNDCNLDDSLLDSLILDVTKQNASYTTPIYRTVDVLQNKMATWKSERGTRRGPNENLVAPEAIKGVV
ncbi:unnamed protein product, partial [Iphiclides podalirius]